MSQMWSHEFELREKKSILFTFVKNITELSGNDCNALNQRREIYHR